MRVITCGSKVPANHFYNTRAILLEEEAIRLCPTFHLQLTFMSSTQFYHSESNVYLSSGGSRAPCYYCLNRAGLLIIAPRAWTLPNENLNQDLLGILCGPAEPHRISGIIVRRPRQPGPGPVTFESRLPELADPAGLFSVRSLI